MFVVLAHIQVVAGREAAFEAAARELAAATGEYEHGVRRYEYLRLSEPTRYQATLAFDDYDAFIEHQASEHHQVIAGTMRDLIAELRLERVDPLVGGLVVAAERADRRGSQRSDIGPADDAVLDARRQHYRARYPLDDAAWWGEVR